MEINLKPSSQILPVSAINNTVSVPEIYKQAEQFFFSQGQLPYKVFKNAYTSSLPEPLSHSYFIQSLFYVIENSIKLQIKEKNQSVQEQSLATKEIFEIIQTSFKLLEKLNLQIDPLVLYAALVGFCVAKAKK